MKEKIDEFHKHEVLDRTHVVINTVVEHIQSHPMVLQYADVGEKVDEAIEILLDLYQLVGTKFNKQE